ncbi:MAG: ribosomal protection-like ABC-F family protein [Anaerovoracaceae bacterium]|jgi:ATP-binding cassette subfamily F protein 3
MIVISAKDLTKEYGTDVILDKVSFHINQGDRVGIVGANGAGKTTLLRMLAGELPCDGGDFFISADTTLGYLKQADDFQSDRTVIEEVESIFASLKELDGKLLQIPHEIADSRAGSPEQRKLIHRHDEMAEAFRKQGGYTYRSEIRGILSSMAFGEETWQKPVSTLSGGERTRLSLAMLLLKKPDLLFLDEPTNHLDIGTLKWLEQYLKGYRGTILLVSHDRYFLDQTATHIFEVEDHRLYTYRGNYTAFAQKKRQRREEEMRKYQSLKKETEKQEEIIRRFKGHGTEKLAKRAASREKKLAKTLEAAGRDNIVMPRGNRKGMKIRFEEKFQSGKDVLLAEGLAKSFGYGSNRKGLFEQVDMDIKRGERICMVGPNGIGKTTLLRILMGELEPSQGYIKRGHNIRFGYYDQGQRLLDEGNTVMEELRETYTKYTDTEIRTILGSFLFPGDTVFLPVSALSGGEKARLSLLKLMLSGANVLMLDEPTNHLDIQSKEVFEDALLDFPGTAIIISHDRYLLKKVPTKIVELGREGLTTFLGNYDYYVEKKEEIESGKQYLEGLSGDDSDREKTDGQMSSAEERRRKKEEEAAERRARRQQEKLEGDIQELESIIAETEEEMCREEVLSDHEKLAELDEKLRKTKDKLASIYEKWLQSMEG